MKQNRGGLDIADVQTTRTLGSLRVNYFSIIALWAIEIKFSIARMKF